jgi:L-lactate dehydrogenase complex protein LldG
MSSQSSREQILSKIKAGLSAHALEMPFPEADKQTDFFTEAETSIEEKFATEFTKLGGKYIYCENEIELFSQLEALRDTMKWNQLYIHDQFLLNLCKEHELHAVTNNTQMLDIEVGITLCECLVARTGSVIMSSGMDHGRALPVYAPVHIVIAFANQLVWNISNAFDFLKEKYPAGLPTMLSLTTGPSRTADIEKTLVVGVHGPKEVYVFFVDEKWKDSK